MNDERMSPAVLSPRSETRESGANSLIASLSIRRAEATDFDELAYLAQLADGETLLFMARGLNPMADPLAIYRDMIADPTGMYAYRNCLVAELGGKIVGLANAFSAHLIENELIGVELTAREKHLLARTELNDPHSYLLNNIAVMPAYLRWRIGTKLLEAVVAEARAQNFSSITLHVWADNTQAIAFYQKFGFEMVRHAAMPWHPELPHVGGSFLFRLPMGSHYQEQLPARLKNRTI